MRFSRNNVNKIAGNWLGRDCRNHVWRRRLRGIHLLYPDTMIHTPTITTVAAGMALLFASATSYAGPHGHNHGNHALFSRAKDLERAAEELHRAIDLSIRYNNESRYYTSRYSRDRCSSSNSTRQLHNLGEAIDQHAGQLVRSVRDGKTGRYLSTQIRHLEDDLRQLSRMSLNRPIRSRLYQAQNALRSLESSCSMADSRHNHDHGRYSSDRDFSRERFPTSSRDSRRERERFSNDVVRAKRVTF